MKKKRETFFAGYHFGMRKQIVKEFAKEGEAERATELMRNIWGYDRLLDTGREQHRPYTSEHRSTIGSSHRDRAELRGLRQVWRVRHSNSFGPGLYTLRIRLDTYQTKLPAGDIGCASGWFAKTSVPAKSVLIFSSRDEIGNCEFIVSNTNLIIKFPRGSTLTDNIEKIKEQS